MESKKSETETFSTSNVCYVCANLRFSS